MVARRSHLSIIAVIAAFFWMLSGVLSAILWVAIPGLKTEWFWVVPSGVVIQEIVRWMFFVGYRRAENAISRALDKTGDEDTIEGRKNTPMNDLSSSISAGVGYGLMQGIILFGSVLENGFGNGTYFTPSCSSMSIFTLMAFTVCFVSIMQVCWMVLAFDGYRRSSAARVIPLFLFHLGSSLITVLNSQKGFCEIALGLQGVLMVVSIYAARLSRKNIFPRRVSHPH